MSRKLSQITQPIEAYLSTNRLRLKMPIGEQHTLPAVLDNARICGEARLILAFYDFVQRQGIQDPERQRQLWQQLLGNGHHLLDVCQHVRLFQYFSAPLADDPKRAAFIAWCILVESLYQSKHSAYNLATTELIRFYFLGLYPKKAQASKDSLAGLKNRALKLIKQHWGADTQLKESFHTDTRPNRFALRIKTAGFSWLTLIECTGERLKPLRLATYKQVLADIESGKIRPDNARAPRLLPVKGKDRA